MKSDPGDNPFADDTSTATADGTTTGPEPLSTAILEAYREQGSAEQLSVRTAEYRALVDAIEARGELPEAIETLAAELGVEPGKETRSRFVELAIGVGVKTALPEWEQGLREAKAEAGRRDLEYV